MESSCNEHLAVAAADAESVAVTMIENLLRPMHLILRLQNKRESAASVERSLKFLSCFHGTREPHRWLQNQELIEKRCDDEFNAMQKLLHGLRLIASTMEIDAIRESLKERRRVTSCAEQCEMALRDLALMRGVRL